ncbi:hypothetical protein FG379_002220 [Cryptosporidium bovis]|uniref:uncharacterized protein n=1 Tax=Cryptosporidium bovis TaxID=310047 RepID=UPI00351A892A|nr:hypothetical protein FG379_002220 [Cryptosporidium bovis]
MKQVSLTIPKPTLVNESEIGDISLTIKSKNNGIQIVNSWPFAIPRYKYDLNDVLEISIYYLNKKHKGVCSNDKNNGSDEINLYSIFNFPCNLLKDIDIIGKKQWILGLERFGLDSNFLTEVDIENSVKNIKLMEEKAKKNFKLSKIYLIFYSCKRTVMNIEEQMYSSHNLMGCIKNNDCNTDRIISIDTTKLMTNIDKPNRISMGIKPEDSVSRISVRTSGSNTLMRTKMIKQNISENSEDLSDAIEMINKYISKSKKNEQFENNNNICDDSGKYDENNSSLSDKIRNGNNSEIKLIYKKGLMKTNNENIANDTTSIVSKAISSSEIKLQEKKISQERLLKLQYIFTLWRQKTKKQISIRMNNNKYKKITSIYKLNRIIELIEIRNKRNFIYLLLTNKIYTESSMSIKKYVYENQQLNNERYVLEEKLNSVISDNHSKMNYLQENMLLKDKEIFELKKRVEYISKLKDELNDKVKNTSNENNILIKEVNTLNNYINSELKVFDEDKNKYIKEKKELELIIDKKIKENTRQSEEIKYLNLELVETKKILDVVKKEKNMYIKLNDELNNTSINIEEEKNKLMNEYNEKINIKNKENEELKLENIKYRENNDLLMKNNNKLVEDNRNYKLMCDELNVEKTSLLNSVYDLINQVENEKMERIRELENSRILFQSINNVNSNNLCFSVNSMNRSNNSFMKSNVNKNNYYLFEDYEDDDLKLEDLKNTCNNDNYSLNNLYKKDVELTVSSNNVLVEIIDQDMFNKGGIKKPICDISELTVNRNNLFVEIINNNRINMSNVNLEKVEIISNDTCNKLLLSKELSIEIISRTNNNNCDTYYSIEKEEERNNQIVDLSERVRILSEEMKKLKEVELIMSTNTSESNIDDTDKIIGSATEMFKIALKNIKNSNIKDEKVDVNTESNNNNNATFPSEFSFNACNNNKDNINIADNDNYENKAHLYKNENVIDNLEKLPIKKKINDYNVRSNNTNKLAINVVSSPLIQDKDINSNNNSSSSRMITYSLIPTVTSPTSSNSSSVILTRSNSMKQNVNNINLGGLSNSNNNNNFGYQYNNNCHYEYNNDNNGGYYFAKRYNSLPRQLTGNNGYYVRTVPPPFFPKN